MTPNTSHRLIGLEPDNLLAFLALLGLLRSLDTARPTWRARAYFDSGTQPLRPVLTLAEPYTADDIAAAAAEGVAELAKAHDFAGRLLLDYSVEDARKIFHELAEALAEAEANPDQAGKALTTQRIVLFDALMSDGAVKDKGGSQEVWPTPFCLQSGQGGQKFLDRLASIPAQAEPPARGRGKKAIQISAAQSLAEALFAPWERIDETSNLRWDPADDRRYALRAKNPSTDPGKLQHGANRLAAIGLPALSGTVVRRRSETRFLARGTSYGADGDIAITWPLWTQAARLSGIRALLAHPALSRTPPLNLAPLAPLGVIAAMQAKRISIGKYFNITPARRL